MMLLATNYSWRSLPGGQPELGGFGHQQEANGAEKDSSEIELQFPHQVSPHYRQENSCISEGPSLSARMTAVKVSEGI